MADLSEALPFHSLQSQAEEEVDDENDDSFASMD